MAAGETFDWIGAAYRERATTQKYGGRRRIEGIQVVDLTLFSDEGGDFCELSRLDDDGCLTALPGYRPAQMSYSLMEPGTIKAWHLHRNQDDLWFVPPSCRLLIGLLDVRESSPSYQVSTRFVLGTGKAQLLLIPRSVAHGVANLTGEPACLIYFVNHAFDREHPDEHRLPFDLLGRNFWSIQPG